MKPSPNFDLIENFLRTLARVRSANTVDTYRYVLVQFDNRLPNGLEANESEIADLLYRDQLTASSMAVYRAALRGFYRHHRGIKIDCDPTENLPRPKIVEQPPKPVTNEELRIVLDQAREPYRLWALLAAHTGARCIELSRLDREHVSRDLTYLHGKGNKVRAIPTHPKVWAAVKDLPAGPVCVDIHGCRASPRYISQRASKHFRKDLGLPDVTMHRFRHWCLTHTHRKTRDLTVTKQLAGHASIATTARYVQVDPADIRLAMEGLPDITVSGERAEA